MLQPFVTLITTMPGDNGTAGSHPETWHRLMTNVTVYRTVCVCALTHPFLLHPLKCTSSIGFAYASRVIIADRLCSYTKRKIKRGWFRVTQWVCGLVGGWAGLLGKVHKWYGNAVDANELCRFTNTAVTAVCNILPHPTTLFLSTRRECVCVCDVWWVLNSF